MDVDAPATPRWSVSARPNGELLTIWRGGEDVLVGVLAVPGPFAPEEYEAWLSDLVGVVRETSRAPAEPGPIPALLHQALTGLLFSHAGLWERSGVAHGSIALIAAGTNTGIGWVGELEVRLTLDGEPFEVTPVIVRDADGREAKAIRLDSRHAVSARLTWKPKPDDERRVRVDAEWIGHGDPRARAPHDDAISGAANELDQEAEYRGASDPDDVAEPPVAAGVDVDATGREGETFDAAAAEEPTLRETDAGPEIAARGRTGRDHPWTRFWAWLTRPFRRRSPVTGGGDEPPWVDIGGLASAEGSEEFYESLEPNLRALGPAGAGTEMPRLRSPGLDADAVTPTHAPRAELDPGMRAIPGDESAAAAPRLRPREPEPLAATLEPHAPLLESAPKTPVKPVVGTPSTPSAASRPSAPPAGSVVVIRGAGAIAEPPRRTPAASSAEAAMPIEMASTPARPSLTSPIADEAEASRALEIETAPMPLRPRPRVEPDVDVSTTERTSPWRTPLRPRWPSETELEGRVPLWRRRWSWAVAVALLFGGGWLVGTVQTDRENPTDAPNALTRMLHAIGFGGARFDCLITSTPPGAWIAVDGHDLARRTPARIELKPGAHQVSLSLQDLGVATLTVRGTRGEQQTLDAPLWGSLSIEQTNPQIPVQVSVDGRDLGFVPMVLDSVMPGTHEVRFSGPGMTPWAQTVEMRVRGNERVVAQPMTSPKTGVLVVNATRMTESGSAPLNGDVWIDGQKRGEAPLTIELPRGPHSVRVAAGGESSPVQVIDLPGGNQRFASFELGLGEGGPRLTPVQIADHVAVDRPTLVSATLSGISVGEVREMWLHVRNADGIWRRYPLDVMKSGGGAVGVSVFPVGVFDEQGRTQYYLSALVATGDEYFTEMATAQLGAP